jgi:hypothetical protein
VRSRQAAPPIAWPDGLGDFPPFPTFPPPLAKGAAILEAGEKWRKWTKMEKNGGSTGESHMLFMVVEKFRNQDGKAVYRKLQQGRGLPDGLKFVASYVSADLSRCFQLMEADDVTLFQRWIADWQALVEFEVVPVVDGKTTRGALEPLL